MTWTSLFQDPNGFNIYAKLFDIPTVRLDIDVSANTPSEEVSINIQGLPDGVILSAGQLNDDNSWTLSVDQLWDLKFRLPDELDQPINLVIKATVTNLITGAFQVRSLATQKPT